MSDTTATPEATKPAPPLLTVVSGNPDDTQVAALTVLFASLAASAAQAEQDNRERNMWGNFSEKHHSNIAYNPSAFRNVEFY
ncbi:acyl-CoA carboxylase subunit epsilon [Corynebacterium choanae]|uniref:Acyl-CoA carboxylase subunit epsilon n=1 Tax=Corynebacterium choanae TaxID=1862358 RepID=A0A3G6J482_9CORY|nr:acyl-CoA carboxylase subunit epsilon [Corynebacterium choanae]AZA12885.1 hypothetical protein CCHOA_02340 [Corynebacterium choanae]